MLDVCCHIAFALPPCQLKFVDHCSVKPLLLPDFGSKSIVGMTGLSDTPTLDLKQLYPLERRLPRHYQL